MEQWECSPLGNEPWIFTGWTNAETAILWLLDAKSWLIGKDPGAGKVWKQEQKGMTEDEMIGWHHWLYGYESEQAPGVGDRQGSLACCSPWGRKESDTTEQLNWTKLILLTDDFVCVFFSYKLFILFSCMDNLLSSYWSSWTTYLR